MRPRRKSSCVSLLPTITEVQEGAAHFHLTQSLDDYMDSMRGLSQPSCYLPHPPQPCPQRPAKMPGLRRAKYPRSGSATVSTASVSAVGASVAAAAAAGNPRVALALVALGPESISLTLEASSSSSSPSSESAAGGRALLWWPHRDPLGWLFTQSQGAAAARDLRLVDDAQDSVCLV